MDGGEKSTASGSTGLSSVGEEELAYALRCEVSLSPAKGPLLSDAATGESPETSMIGVRREFFEAETAACLRS